MLWTQGAELEDPTDGDDQGKLTWKQEEANSVWVAGHLWRGCWSVGMVRPPGLTERPHWVMVAWSRTRAPSQMQAG